MVTVYIDIYIYAKYFALLLGTKIVKFGVCQGVGELDGLLLLGVCVSVIHQFGALSEEVSAWGNFCVPCCC